MFFMYIAAGQGQTTPGENILMSTETSYHFGHLQQVSKNLFEVWFYTFFFFITLYMYIALGQGLVSKKCLWSLNKYNFFHDLIHVYIAPGQGQGQRQTAPWGQNFDVNRKALWLYPFVASFKEIYLKSDFKQFFSWGHP